MRGGAPVYIVKPKYIFKHPFNKYDLGNPTNRQTQNEELTDYFNYGYNEDTMNIYGKLVKRFIEVLDHNKNLEYFNEPSELMRLNDEIPMDFGGFCKFHNPYIVDNQTREDFHSGQPLMRYFIMMIFASASRKIEYPLIEFIKNMYKKEGEEDGTQDTILFDIIEQIGKNLEQRYQETLEKLRSKQNELKNPPKKHEGKERQGKQGRQGKEHREPKENRENRDNRGNKDRQNRQNRGRDRDIQHESKDKDRDRDRERGERQKEKEKQREKQREKIQPEKSGSHKDKNHPKKDKGGKKSQHDSSDSSEDSSDSSSSQQSDDRKRKHEKEGGRSKSEDQRRKNKKKDKVRDKKKKQKKDKDKDRQKDKHKTKKVKKQKSHKRSKSRDKKKKHH